MQVAGLIAGLPIPTLVVINGDALDHGMELALAGDMRIAVGHARMGITDLARGGFPWDGGTQRLPRLVGPAWARDMLLTSRVIGAGEALELGLVNRVVEPDQLAAAVEQLVGEITSGGPIAARYAKEAINNGMEVSLTQGLRLEADLNVILQSTEDRAEGLRSFTERRTPRFSGS
jgi:enoyl-CoA hydratase/carnithine racemase